MTRKMTTGSKIMIPALTLFVVAIIVFIIGSGKGCIDIWGDDNALKKMSQGELRLSLSELSTLSMTTEEISTVASIQHLYPVISESGTAHAYQFELDNEYGEYSEKFICPIKLEQVDNITGVEIILTTWNFNRSHIAIWPEKPSDELIFQAQYIQIPTLGISLPQTDMGTWETVAFENAYDAYVEAIPSVGWRVVSIVAFLFGIGLAITIAICIPGLVTYKNEEDTDGEN